VVADFAQQGGLLLARLLNPPQGDVILTFADTPYPMLREGDRAFAVIAIPTSWTPADYTLMASVQGQAVASATVSVAAADFPEEYITLPPDTASLLTDPVAIEEERKLLAAVYDGPTSQRLWSGAWQTPSSGLITNPFGLMRSINDGPLFPHSGTDFAADEETPVLASAAGRVALAQRLYLYGNAVVIDHGASVFSSYNHLAKSLVAEGQMVAPGQQIGTVGATGLVTGPHLHWEAIVHGVRMDPAVWTFRPLEP
jgi:murein DD-endopeptidase MepM/ murein hydrolase activator NlpD